MRNSTPRSGRPAAIIAGLASILAILLVWELSSRALGKEIILPSPERVFGIAAGLYPTSRFLEALAATFLRGLSAFALSAVVGGAAGIASGLRPSFGAFLSPILTLIRATPVLAIILLALLWFPSGFVPVFSAFLMAFPVMASSAQEGVKAADPRLLEMAALFRVPRGEVFRHIRIPSAAGHLAAGARSALGLSWKVVVAGEVLSQPVRALGSGMQESRMMLETGSVFAWAFASIALCGATELAFALAERKARRRDV
jgi:NitT/TauT family transport system permease protein